MYNRIIKATLALAVCVPSLAGAQQGWARGGPDRAGSWELSLGGGALFVDSNLRDFLGSGAPESRFADSSAPGSVTPTLVARVGYNFNRHFGISASAGGARSSGLTYLNPTAALTYTANLNASTSPFVLIGTELTRISGGNDRVTHSTWGAHAGLGIRQMVSDNFALRLEGRVQLAHFDEVPMSTHTTYSPLAQLGFSYFVGGRHATYVDPPRPPCECPRPLPPETVYVDRPVPNTVRVHDGVLPVHFRTNEAVLLPRGLEVLDSVANAIKTTPGSRWVVEGHTDFVGTAEANRVLSQARAQAVVNYLVGRGVDAGILAAEGYGEDRPVSTNDTVEGRGENRRVQLRRVVVPPAIELP